MYIMFLLLFFSLFFSALSYLIPRAFPSGVSMTVTTSRDFYGAQRAAVGSHRWRFCFLFLVFVFHESGQCARQPSPSLFVYNVHVAHVG